MLIFGKETHLNMKPLDTKHQKFKAFTELHSSRCICTKQNNLQSLPPLLTNIHVC